MLCFRTAPKELWRVRSDVTAERRSRLQGPPEAIELLHAVESAAKQAIEAGDYSVTWQEASDFPDHFRIVWHFRIGDVLFDQFFNGASGYRAQYNWSPDCGAAFNRCVLEALLRSASAAAAATPNLPDWDTVSRSYHGSWSKMWVYGDGSAFSDADVGLENERWVSNKATQGLKIPNPLGHQLDVKGTFVHRTSGREAIDDYKVDRSVDLYMRGFS